MLVSITAGCKLAVISYQIELIADPYSDQRSEYTVIELELKLCTKCKKNIGLGEVHKIVMFVVREKFTDHHYEHIECPDRFTV